MANFMLLFAFVLC